LVFRVFFSFFRQYFQLVNGYSPMQAGLAELPAALAAILFGVQAGLAVRYWSPPAVLAVGLERHEVGSH
jgi:DHA2 family multidrug resistance protein-like MFS transporter